MKTSLQDRKLVLIESLAKTQDEKVIKKVEKILGTLDWWDELPEKAKESIKKGEDDFKNGRVKPHKEVMKKYKKWL